MFHNSESGTILRAWGSVRGGAFNGREADTLGVGVVQGTGESHVDTTNGISVSHAVQRGIQQ